MNTGRQGMAVQDFFVDLYREVIDRRFPDQIARWPLLASFGFEVEVGTIGDTNVLIYRSDNGATRRSSGVGDVASRYMISQINDANREAVRAKIEDESGIGPRGAVVFIKPDVDLQSEVEATMQRHQRALGLLPQKIFLSHKTVDKTRVRLYYDALTELGFDPWYDEIDLKAGTKLHRGLEKGFSDACAVVFFVTRAFVDESFIEKEIDYAVEREREANGEFKIISLALEDDVVIPKLLRPYVFKKPMNDLDGFREILRALPLKVGRVTPR